MKLDTEACYRALTARDSRFDGAFYVGVATTGIYCRTVCTAKTPRAKNCSFFPSAAAAEKRGYRPCLRCRPELAPGNARMDAASRLAAIAAARIDDGALADQSLAELAADLGVTDRHLRRVIHAEFGVSPVALAQTQRLHLAKRLLTDTNIPITAVAFASGFASLRRFNAVLRERYRLKPTEIRTRRGTGNTTDTFECEIAYRPPMDWDSLIEFLGRRAVRGVEEVAGDCYRRTVCVSGHRGWIAARPAGARPAVRLQFSASLVPALSATLARVRRLLDLAAEPLEIASHLGALATAHPGLRVPGAFCGFEIAVRAVLGQQVSVQAASTLAGRVAKAIGEPIETPYPALSLLSPTPDRLAALEPQQLSVLGITTARARTLVSLARPIADRSIKLEPGADVERVTAQLTGIPGIGEWTAQYIAMRALAWPDAFPHTDLGIRKALGMASPAEVLAAADAWRPWRSYAAMHLWKSLDHPG